VKAGGVKVDIRDPEFITISRQRQLGLATNLAEEIGKASFQIVKDAWDMKKPIRMLTVTGIGIRDDEEEQLSLFGDPDGTREKAIRIESAVDRIRAKYGSSAITFGSVIGNDIGLHLEDSTEEEY
jgi:DNA polymerase-4